MAPCSDRTKTENVFSAYETVSATPRPPMTAWGQARFDAAVPSSRSPGPEGDRVIPGKENDPTLACFPDGIPKILTSPEPFEIITIANRVLMFFEKDHGWRQIWTDGRKLPADPPELRFDGYSVGRWEGDTFVVESSGFNDNVWLDNAGRPATEQLKVTERFVRKNFGQMEIQITIDDPKAYTKPWSVTQQLAFQADTELLEYICNENNKYFEIIPKTTGGSR